MALIAWLYVLKQVDVSYAYPFISLGFVFVLLISYQFFNETINLYKIAGIMSIILGVFLISRS
ncbi:MAG: EamA family transporter, partial [Gammaproteobacteria bacterium]|nr:EamA family transporter [Gammaproteobacteria bacterium]